MNEERLARGLGWFSVGVGLLQLLAPRAVGRAIGVGEHPVLLQLIGMRELTSGVGLLSRRRPGAWLQTRVAGDVMDLALLGAAFAADHARNRRLTATAATVVGVTALDVLVNQKFRRNPGAKRWTGRVVQKIRINAAPEQVYGFWRDVENLPRFMHNLESVHITGPTRSHWVAKAPAGTSVEWDAQTIADKPGELIAWRTLPGSNVDHAGSVRFKRAPVGGTRVIVEMEYSIPGGIFGDAIAAVFGDSPRQQVRADLRRLKQLIEAGDVALDARLPAPVRRSRRALLEKYQRTVVPR